MADSHPFRCTECQLICSNAGALRQHTICHNRTAAFKCSECSYAVKYSTGIVRHMKNAHPNAISSYNTPTAEKTPKKKSRKLAVTGGEEEQDVGVEMPEKVTSKQGYFCKDCGTISRYQLEFDRHAACHAGNFPYRCLICNFGNNTKRNITHHGKKVHPGQKVLRDQEGNAKSRSKMKIGKEQLVYDQEELERNSLDCEAPEKEKPVTAKPRVSKPNLATAKLRVPEDNLRKRRFVCKLRVPENLRAKQKPRGTSEMSQRETAPTENGTGVDTEAAAEGPTSSGAGEVGRSSQDVPPALHLAALLAQRAAIKVNLAQVEQQIKNLEYLELIKTLPTL